MKMYLIFILAIFTTIVSCKYIKVSRLASKQELKFNQQSIAFELENNRILLLDDVGFLLDIGAPNVIFENELNKHHVKDSVIIGHLEQANGKKISNKVVVLDSLNNALFNGTNAVFRVLPSKTVCQKAKGLIGCELFQEKIISIDFDKNEFPVYPESKNISTTGYQKIKVLDFDGYYFYIELVINNISLKVKLDTGNNYDLLLKSSDFEKIINPQIEYAYFQSKNNIDTLLSKGENVKFGNNQYKTTLISNKYLKRNLIGVGFMRNFNWIIDYNKGEVYIQNLKNSSFNASIFQKNKVIIKDSEKLIVYQAGKDNLQSLGSVIKSIDGVAINKANVCHFYNMLNKSSNWGPFSIVFF